MIAWLEGLGAQFSRQRMFWIQGRLARDVTASGIRPAGGNMPMAKRVDAIAVSLAEHSVLLFKGQQHLTPEAHVEFSRRLGQLESHVLRHYCLLYG